MAGFEIREFKATDVFAVARMLSKVDVCEIRARLSGDRLMSIIASSARDPEDDDVQGQEGYSGVPDAREVGIDIVLDVADILLTNMCALERDLLKWLGSMSGTKDVGDLPAGEFVELVEAVCESDGFGDFFTAVSRWMERKKASRDS